MDSLHYFKDRRVLVTGAAHGMGATMATLLAQAGARLSVCDRDADALSEKVQAWSGLTEVSQKTFDVSDLNLLRDWISRQEPVFCLINNAGIGMAGEFSAMSWEDWELVRKVNLDSVIAACMQVLPGMKTRGSGHIVNMASLYGITPSPLASLYGSTKHAIWGLSQAMDLELRGTGVKVSVAAPGYVQTKIFHHAVNRGTDEKTQLSVIPWKLYPAEKAARRILQDVSRGKLEIVFPIHARLTWWLSRNFPRLFRMATLKMIYKHRKLARE